VWAIQIRGDGRWHDLVTKIESEEEANRLLPRVAAVFLPSLKFQVAKQGAQP
jgi:hypothetical protein